MYSEIVRVVCNAMTEKCNVKCVEKGFESENNINSEFDASTTAIQASLNSKTKKTISCKINSLYFNPFPVRTYT